MFDETISINDDGTIEGLDITLFDVAKLCEGRDEDEIPRAFGVMQINAIHGEETEAKYQFEFKEAEYSVHLSGGCVVVVASVDARYSNEINEMMKTVSPYIDLRQYNPGEDVLTFSLVPLHYSGNFFFIFTAAAFVRAYRKDAATWEVVMAFDNGNTCPVIAEDIDLKSEAEYIEAELAEINRINDAKYAQLKADVKKIEDEEMYRAMVEPIMGLDEETKAEETFPSGIRIAKEEEEE